MNQASCDITNAKSFTPRTFPAITEVIPIGVILYNQRIVINRFTVQIISLSYEIYSPHHSGDHSHNDLENSLEEIYHNLTLFTKGT